MDNLVESISEFIGNLVAVALVGGSLFLFAGEIRMAALKKASFGSAKLSGFTARMTDTHGGLHGSSKKSR